MDWLFLFLALCFLFILPAAAGVFMCVRKKAYKAVLQGAAYALVVWCVFSFMLPNWDAYIQFQLNNPIWGYALQALAAGVVLEIGRYLIFRLAMPKGDFKDGLGFGIGYGCFFALLQAGANVYSYSVLIQANIWMLRGHALSLAGSGLDNIFGILSAVGLSVIIWQAVALKKPAYLLFAVAVHILIVLIRVVLMSVEAPYAVFSVSKKLVPLVLLAYVVYVGRKHTPPVREMN